MQHPAGLEFFEVHSTSLERSLIQPARQPSITIISRRGLNPHVGWVAIDEFEDLFASYFASHIVSPRSRKLPPFLGRIIRRFRSSVRFEDDVPKADVLFVVARSPSDLDVLKAIPSWRKKYKKVVAYVIDSYFLKAFPNATRLYDHIFVTTQEAMTHLKNRFQVPCSILRQGMDCLRWAPQGSPRSIDLLGFGRLPNSYHREFQRSFHRAESPWLYVHSPIGAIRGPDIWRERPMLLKLMQRSRLCLAFHLLVEPTGTRPRAMFVTSRWFEALAAGCVVIGKRPSGDMADEMLCWPEAAIELPDAPSDAVQTIEGLLTDSRRLAAISERNVLEMRQRHDWRYRLINICTALEISIPDRLAGDIISLNQRPARGAIVGCN